MYEGLNKIMTRYLRNREATKMAQKDIVLFWDKYGGSVR